MEAKEKQKNMLMTVYVGPTGLVIALGTQRWVPMSGFSRLNRYKEMEVL